MTSTKAREQLTADIRTNIFLYGDDVVINNYLEREKFYANWYLERFPIENRNCPILMLAAIFLFYKNSST